MSTDPAEYGLALHHLTVRFGGLTALDDVSLRVPPGRVVGIIGPNGAGKTTLFNVICGFVSPQSGALTLDGRPFRPRPHHLNRHGIARTLQGVGQFGGMTVLENVLVGLRPGHQRRTTANAGRRATEPQPPAPIEASPLGNGRGITENAVGQDHPEGAADGPTGRDTTDHHHEQDGPGHAGEQDTAASGDRQSKPDSGHNTPGSHSRPSPADRADRADRTSAAGKEKPPSAENPNDRSSAANHSTAGRDGRRSGPWGRRSGEGEAFAALERCGVAEYAHSYPAALPYAKRKRVELARALVSRPRILMLDEPAGGLDADEIRWLAGLIRDAGTTVLLVEHHMDLVMSVCDQILVLDFGKPIALGSPDEIRADPKVAEAYLGTAA